MLLTTLTRLASRPLAKYVTNASKHKVAAWSPTSVYVIRQYNPSPLNKKGVESELVKTEDEEEYEVEVQEPVQIEPVPQKLINRIPVEHHGVSPKHFSDDTNWLPVYRVPWIRSLRLVIRLKVYMTAASVGGSLYYTAQVLMGNWSGEIWRAGSLALISLAGMTFIGDYFRRLVVQIYASEDCKHVRFCRFSFFGRRKDMVLPVDCVIRLPEINRSLRQPMMDIKFRLPEDNKIDADYDNYEFYELGFKLPIGLGGVLDPDRFQRVVGYMLSYRIGG